MTTAIKSFTNEKSYELTINEQTGEATNCQCPDHQYRGHTCKHMMAFNREVQRAATFILLQRMVREVAETSKAWREYAEIA